MNKFITCILVSILFFVGIFIFFYFTSSQNSKYHYILQCYYNPFKPNPKEYPLPYEKRFTGIWRQWSKDGQLIGTVDLKKGLLHGKSILWPSKLIRKEGYHLDGKFYGKHYYRLRLPSALPYQIKYYKGGKLEKLVCLRDNKIYLEKLYISEYESVEYNFVGIYIWVVKYKNDLEVHNFEVSLHDIFDYIVFREFEKKSVIDYLEKYNINEYCIDKELSLELEIIDEDQNAGLDAEDKSKTDYDDLKDYDELQGKITSDLITMCYLKSGVVLKSEVFLFKDLLNGKIQSIKTTGN